jgi:hypothetical protein
MAKKKQKKEKEKFEYSNEVIGVLFVLLSIIGMLGYGVAGNFIRSFSAFLVGVAYFPLLLTFLFLGLYLIVKRTSPRFISRLSIGIYLIVMALLTLIHMEYVDTPIYDSAYIEGINNLYEFDAGAHSGWMYRVNGDFPNYGCSGYSVADGDIIEWVYTCDLGNDVGNDNAERMQ